MEQQKRISDQWMNRIVAVLVVLLVLLYVPQGIAYLLAPANDTEALQVWQQQYDRLYNRMLLDAQQGKEKDVTSYTLYQLYRGDREAAVQLDDTYQMIRPVRMRLESCMEGLFGQVCLLKYSGQSAGYTNQQVLETDQKAEQVAASIKAGAQQNERDMMYELLAYTRNFAEYLRKNEQFEQNKEEKWAHEAWSCLISGAPVCDGYSRACYLICDKLDIPAVCVLGGLDSDTVNHMWNLVYVDGAWRHLDLTNCDWTQTLSDYDLGTLIDQYGTEQGIALYYDVVLPSVWNQADQIDSKRESQFFLVDEATIRESSTYDTQSVTQMLTAKYPDRLEDYQTMLVAYETTQAEYQAILDDWLKK